MNYSKEAIARVCHEANRAWCAANGDTSQPTWERAPDWQKASAVNGVAFYLANPDAEASDVHDNWYAEKKASGWVYGSIKDPAAKTHHCMVPFDELPYHQQLKDHLFKAIVGAIGRP